MFEKREEARDEETAMAAALYDLRRARRDHFNGVSFVEPGWDMLLFQFANLGRPISIGELCKASCVPRTTAIRYIADLKKQGLLEIVNSTDDARIFYTRLSPVAESHVRKYLEMVRTFQIR